MLGAALRVKLEQPSGDRIRGLLPARAIHEGRDCGLATWDERRKLLLGQPGGKQF